MGSILQEDGRLEAAALAVLRNTQVVAIVLAGKGGRFVPMTWGGTGRDACKPLGPACSSSGCRFGPPSSLAGGGWGR